MKFLNQLNRIALTWWFGHAVLLAFASGVVLAAVLLTPSTDVLTLFGVEIPMVCSFRRLTGVGCPGCGLTRSFTFMAHGQLWGAFQMNYLGPLAFVVTAAQIPWRCYRLFEGRARGFWAS